MDASEDLKREGFIEASRKKGHLKASLGTDKLDSDFDSVNYVTPQGNIGYTVAKVGDSPVAFFCSVTARGIVATLPDPGLEMGPELTIRGTKMRFTKPAASLKEMLDEHKKALAGESVLMNRPRLEKELDLLPQRIIDLLITYAKEHGEG